MIRLALRNLTRQKLRTSVTLGAIAFGIAGLVISGGFVRDMFIQLGEAAIHSQTGHLQVAKEGYFASGAGMPEKFRIDDSSGYERAIRSVAGVKSVMARIDFSGLLSNGRTDQAIVGEGVEPDKEAALGTYLRVVDGRALTDRDTYGIMVGQGVAQALKLKAGGRVTLLVNTADGALNTLDFEVTGVFQTFSRDFDARAVRISLRAARDALATHGTNVIVVELRDTEDTGRVAGELRHQSSAASLDVRTWKELNDFYDKTVTLYRRQFGILQAIILAMVLLGVANSVNMGAFERVGEFGTMMALGNSRRDVFRLVVTESALLGLIGGALGVALGVGAALALSRIGIPMPPPPNANLGYRAMIRVVPEVIGMAFLAGFGAATLAALLPATRVSRMPIVEALRANV